MTNAPRKRCSRLVIRRVRRLPVTSFDAGHPAHIVAGWHGHDPAVLLSIYSDAKADELRAASASLFG